jgi:diguanylate cyclase (GGDEF)-like protein
MTIAPAPVSPFDQLTASPGDELAMTAASIVNRANSADNPGSLVIAVHPDGDDHRVLAASGIGVLRAAVSVAVASGHDRLWSAAPDGDTIEQAVRSLPEVVRAAAEAAEVIATHIGCVRSHDRVECVAIWFESHAGVTPVGERRHTMQLLAAAAERDAVRHSEEAALAASMNTESDDQPAQPTRRQFDANDPDLDSLTGVANRRRFEQALEQYDSDQATLVVIDIDHFDQIGEDFGKEIADLVLLETADRLSGSLRKSDLVARIDADTFAILFGDVDRSTALQISRRFLNLISEPLPTDIGPEAVTATIALAHQFGLVDTQELMESASDALESGKRSGRGRLVLAS